jgi:creatinine amidohydrolase
MVTDVAESLHRSGIDRLPIVNGHGGNYVLSNIVQQANVGRPWMTLFPGRTEWETARAAAGLQTAASEDMHGDWQADERPHLLVTGMGGYTEAGVLGRPSLARAGKGRSILDSLERSFKDHLALLL